MMLGTTGMTLTLEAIDRYQQWCIARGRSTNTVRAYGSDLKEFLKAAGENGQILPEEYEDLAFSWLNLTRQKVSPKTTARRLTSLRGWAKWAKYGTVLDDYIAPTPARSMPHPIPEGEDGLERMISVAKNPEQVALITLGGYVGCRISESLSVDLHNLDLQNRTLLIRGKGDKERVVPLSDKAVEYLQDSIIDAVVKPDHKLVSYQDRFARQIIKNLGLRAGLKREVASHDLRATYATIILSQTNNIRLVQELLGHASVATTEVYTGISMDQMRAAVNF
jgi:site-specific recombinase XerD